MSHAGLVEKAVRFGPLTIKTFVRPEELETDPEILSGAAIVLPSPHAPSSLSTPYATSTAIVPYNASSALSPAPGPLLTTPISLKRKRGRPPKETQTPSTAARNGLSTTNTTGQHASSPAARPKNRNNAIRANNPLKVTGQPLLHLLTEEEKVALNRRHKQGRDFIPSWIGVVKELKRLGRPVSEEELARIHEENFGKAARRRAEAEAQNNGPPAQQEEQQREQQIEPSPNLYQQPEQTEQPSHHPFPNPQSQYNDNQDGLQHAYAPLRPHDVTPSGYAPYHNPFGPYEPPSHRDPTVPFDPAITLVEQNVSSSQQSIISAQQPSTSTPPVHPPPTPSEQATGATALTSPPPPQTLPPSPPTESASSLSSNAAEVVTFGAATRERGADITLTVSTPDELISTLRNLISSNINALGIPEVLNCRLNLTSAFPFPAPLSTNPASMHPDAFKTATSHIATLVQEADGFSWAVRRINKRDFYRREWSCSQFSATAREAKAANGRPRYDCAGTMSVNIKPTKDGRGNDIWLCYRHHAIHGPPENGRGAKRIRTEVMQGQPTTENSLQQMFEQWEKPKVLKSARMNAAQGGGEGREVQANLGEPGPQ